MDERVSIIITCHNLETYLSDCVNSIYSQTVRPKEVIIVHDGCKKPTVWSSCNTYFRNNNIGVAKSREEGVKLTSGEYIMFLDADDALAENYIENALVTIQGVDVAYPNILLLSHWGEEKKQNGWYSPAKRITFDKLIKKNEVVVTSLMRRKVYEKVGGFDDTLPIFEDWDFFLKALRQGFKFRQMTTFLKYRQRTQSRNHQSKKIREETFRLIRDRHIALTKKNK